MGPAIPRPETSRPRAGWLLALLLLTHAAGSQAAPPSVDRSNATASPEANSSAGEFRWWKRILRPGKKSPIAPPPKFADPPPKTARPTATGVKRDEPGDFLLITRCQAIIYADRELAGANLFISARDGVISLRGTVPSPILRDRAERLARSTPGARAVLNEARVEGDEGSWPSSPTIVLAPPPTVAIPVSPPAYTPAREIIRSEPGLPVVVTYLVPKATALAGLPSAGGIVLEKPVAKADTQFEKSHSLGSPQSLAQAAGPGANPGTESGMIAVPETRHLAKPVTAGVVFGDIAPVAPMQSRATPIIQPLRPIGGTETLPKTPPVGTSPPRMIARRADPMTPTGSQLRKLAQAAGLDRLEFEVVGRDVRLKGHIADAGRLADFVREISSLPSVDSVDCSRVQFTRS